MGSSSVRHAPEFKQRAVELYNASGATFAAVARDPGMDDGPLSKWARAANNETPGVPEANIFQAREENRRLKRELARVREENEALLKASAFFASRQLRGRPGSSS